MKLSITALLLFLITVSLLHVTPETITCSYLEALWWEAKGNLYLCALQNEENFSNHQVIVDKAIGKHHLGKSNDDVDAFFIGGTSNISKFPGNLDKAFGNLISIHIRGTPLKEITAEDLKPFIKLKFLYLHNTQIELISEDLFESNQLLEVVSLQRNKIAHIDRRAFSGLSILRALALNGNVCQLGYATTRKTVLTVIEQIENGKCESPKFTTTENPLKIVVSEQNNEIEKLTSELKEKTLENEDLKVKIVELSQENGSCLVKVQELETKVNNFAVRHDKMERNVERILEKMDQQSATVEGCKNEKIVEKLDQLTDVISSFQDSCREDFEKLSIDNNNLHGLFDILNHQFATFMSEDMLKKKP